MIYGIGTDIVRTERIKSAVDRWGGRFLRRVFTEDEIAYSYRKKEPYLSLSVRFAAKEALIKAAGSGVPVSFRDIEVRNSETGRPVLKVTGSLKSLLEERSISRAHLSLSHEQEYGIAFVVLEGE